MLPCLTARSTKSISRHSKKPLSTAVPGLSWALTITDWGGAHDTREAALNGLDIEMGTFTNGLTSESANTYDEYYLGKPFQKLIESGEVPVEAVDNKVRNILRLIFRTAMNPDKPFGSIASPEHYAAAIRHRICVRPCHIQLPDAYPEECHRLAL